MELSTERQQQILEEEQHRIAEERFRVQVRARLQQPQATPVAPLAQPASPAHRQAARSIGKRVGGWVLVILGVYGALALVGFLLSTRSVTTDGASVSTDHPLLSRWIPVTVSLAKGQFQVRAQNYISWSVVVPQGVRNYHVTGQYSAIGGGVNDIQAAIATEDEFQNWINGQQARVFYGTPGRVTTGHVDVVLPPGRYVLAFNNRFSLFTDKAVFAEINATYEQNL